MGNRSSKELLSKELAIVVTPGAWISDVDKDGFNPGNNFVRFALVPPLEDVKIAAEKIKKFYEKRLDENSIIMCKETNSILCYHPEKKHPFEFSRVTLNKICLIKINFTNYEKF